MKQNADRVVRIFLTIFVNNVPGFLASKIHIEPKITQLQDLLYIVQLTQLSQPDLYIYLRHHIRKHLFYPQRTEAAVTINILQDLFLLSIPTTTSLPFKSVYYPLKNQMKGGSAWLSQLFIQKCFFLKLKLNYIGFPEKLFHLDIITQIRLIIQIVCIVCMFKLSHQNGEINDDIHI